MKRTVKGALSLIAAIAILASSLSLFSSCKAPITVRQDTQYRLFSTYLSLIDYSGDGEDEFERRFDTVVALATEYDRLFDIYNEYEGINNLYTVNANAGIAPVKVDEKIIAMLEQAVELYHLTGGKMNIAMGSMLRVWHDVRTAADELGWAPDRKDNPTVPLPPMATLLAANEHTDINNLIIDREAGTVYLADPEMRLDVGSCGKGYACEMVARAAEERGLTCFSLSVGGNLRNAGVKPGNNEWTGGIQDPFDPNSNHFLQAVFVTDKALVTSGDYQRYFIQDDVRYHHLIDPATLQPAAYYRSVSILCADSGVADCLSTGVFCMPLEEGMALIESLDGVEAYWVLPDGSTAQTSGWDNYTRK